jgi:hypothetical protein
MSPSQTSLFVLLVLVVAVLASAVCCADERAAGGAGPPDPDCPQCRGLGLVPHEKAAVYMHMEGRPLPDAADSICGRYCPKCQAGQDPAVRLASEVERLKTAQARHEEWEAKLQLRLTRIETRQVVIHAQVPAAEARRVAQAMEAMTNHLQQLTGTLLLTPRRPAVDDMFLFVDKTGYERLIGCLEGEPQYARVNWEFLRRLTGATVDQITFLQRPTSGVPLEDLAVHGSASRQMQMAASGRAPAWLAEGFAAYCEYQALKQNLIHSVDPQGGDIKLGANWDLQIRQLARLGKLQTWDEMFAKDLAVFEAIHYLQSKSMVTFLLKEPGKFQDLVAAIAAGAESSAALEKAYGEPVKELETKWRRGLGVR